MATLVSDGNREVWSNNFYEELKTTRKKQLAKMVESSARSKKPYEALRLMEMKSHKALIKYLNIRLDQSDLTQTTLSVAWLLEIIISSISVAQTQKNSEPEVSELKQELDGLLENKQVLDCLARHPKLFYGIIRNYSDQETFVKVAKLIEDYDDVVQHYMNMGEFSKALEIMKLVKKDKYFYSHGHLLMKRIPKELVDALMQQPNLVPSKLIPVLIQENPYFNKCSETIRYLEFCIQTLGSESRVIHNYLFELYARHRSEETLIEYLESEVKPNLDLQRSSRLCLGLGLKKACAILYCSMGLFEEALDLALDLDFEAAKGIAKKAESSDHQKRLWLKIADHVLTNNLDIQIARGLLRESRLLKVEDILPFFPNYTKIDIFKDAIINSIREYRNERLLVKDGTYENSANEIRNEMKVFKNRYLKIKSGQQCEICYTRLSSQAFCVFPCGHIFHKECIIKEIISIDPNYLDEDLLGSKECLHCGTFMTRYINTQPTLAAINLD